MNLKPCPFCGSELENHFRLIDVEEVVDYIKNNCPHIVGGRKDRNIRNWLRVKIREGKLPPPIIKWEGRRCHTMFSPRVIEQVVKIERAGDD